MMSIRDALHDLHHAIAARGCFVMLHDGDLVAATLGARRRADEVSGLTSFLTVTLNRVLEEVHMGSFQSFGMQSDHGDVLVVDLGESYLVILADPATGLHVAMPEIREAAQRLGRLSKIPI